MSNPWQQLYQIGLQRRTSIAGSVAKKQSAWLHSCLQRNQKSAYGQQFQFEKIQTVNQFRNQVPLVTYQDVEPWIERIARGEKNVLFEGTPILFERTGGSTGGSKLIPYSAASLADFQTAILPWLADVVEYYNFTTGCAYWAISPALRAAEKTVGGIPVGASDGVYLGDEAMQPFRALSAVPLWVAEITNVEEWRLATLYWLVRKSNLELISVWSPTFFTTLIDGLDQHQENIKSLLHNGGKIAGYKLDQDAEALQRFQRYSESRDTRILWPHLKLVSCWSEASSKPFYEELVRRLPQAQFQGKGLLSTEGVVTIPNKEGETELTINAGFYEFLDNDGQSWLPQELNLGEQYQVVITTSGGLYRYCTGDYVICDNKKKDLPILRFGGRLGLSSDLVGEKLTEAFVTKCLEGIPGFRLLVPILGKKPKYGLLIDESNKLETIVDRVEEQLKLNSQYAYARQIGQLEPLVVYPVHAPLETYMKWAIKNGNRMGDIKVPSLRPETDWLETFLDTFANSHTKICHKEDACVKI
jgi:hypothetical protein